MGQILVGTASWTDKTLIESGRFYPRAATSAEERLRYYATQFPLVEVDSTYYALPAERTAELWAERTPPGFVFNVKAFRLFTGHAAQRSALPADLRGAKDRVYYRDLDDSARRELWQRFRAGLEPLVRAGKLGAVLLQFAPWFVFGRERLAHIAHCARMLEGLPLAVELRNKSWFGEKRAAERSPSSASTTSPMSWSTSRRAFLPASRRCGKRPPPSSRSCACTGATARPGRRKASRAPPSASTTCTRARSWRRSPTR
jgi:uncharacterized protein YecE (DUF72 family)